jgi:DNA-binding NarL/FixJ family response regulator
MPLSGPAIEHDCVVAEPLGEADGGRPSVLIVDDDPTIRVLVRTVLERDGRFGSIETADGGYEAIEICYRMHPTLVVLDLAMWELSGYETMPQLRARHPEVKIVVYTASYDERMRTEALARGADAMLPKSTPVVELPSRLMEVLR